MNPPSETRPAPRVGLFVTCLANVFRPGVAESTLRLLRRAGCTVEVPLAQSCCGQPGYNAGAIAAAKPIARQLIETFEPFDYVVTPSGSCAGMIAHHYPKLFADEAAWQARALALAAKTREITQFLVDMPGWEAAPAQLPEARRFTYHDSCAGLREMGIKAQPRKLLAALGVSLTEMQGTEVCCGFGGTFCAKLPDISLAMADEKIAHALASGADTLVGGDLGCLLHLAGRIAERGLALEVRHVTEVLDGTLESPALGSGPR
ncbi:MAG: (Fe-S)-binding protein [Gammaproteobacteria bacterium]|nr:(Fe-S)-binding protein [Gammaproteobacteria bacterium]